MGAKVEVLMPTYNGQKYISEQLDSIWNQDYFDVHVIIRDDGSTDRTMDVIYENCVGKNVNVLAGKNIGVIRGYFRLFHELPNDVEYIALCDQDDVWEKDKISTAVKMLEKEDNNIPLLYCSAVQPVDEKLNPIHSAITYKRIVPSFGNALVENICTGCTAVFNRALLDLIIEKEPEFTIMHDFWIYLVASCFGKVLYDKTPHILYRQHTGNQIGMTKTRLQNYMRRVKNFPIHRGQLMMQASSFDKIYKDIPMKHKVILQRFLNSRKNMLERIKLISTHMVYRQNSCDNFIFKCFLLLGIL